MKVESLIDWKFYKLIDKEVDRARTKGETWEINKERYNELTNNVYSKLGFALIKEVK